MTQLTRGIQLCIVFALCVLGAVLSAQAQAPRILRHPETQTSGLNSNAVFDVLVDPGAGNVRYQWRLNGGNVPGAIARSFSVSDIKVDDAGVYSVVVFNDFGAVTSDPAQLRLGNLPSHDFSDAFADAKIFSGTSGLMEGKNFDATAESGEPQHAGRSPKRTVWATWMPPSSGPGIVTFRTAGSTFDTVLAVYTGDFRTGLKSVASDDDSGPFLNSEVTFRAQPQTPFHIVIDGFGGAQGNFLLSWKFEATTEILPLFVTEPLDQTVAAGAEASFTVVGEGNFTWQWFFNGQLLENQTEPTLRVKDVSAAEVGDYFCRAFSGQRYVDTRRARLQIHADDTGGVDPFSISTEKFLDARVRADEDRGKSGAKSIAHGFSGTQIFSTVGATKEIGEPNHCGVAGGASEWFAYQAEADGTLYIDTDGSSFDTVLAVYTGPGDSYATLVSVACDNNSGLDGKDSRVSLPATAGTIYWIAVDGVNNPSNGQVAKGSVALHWRLVLPLRLSALAYSNVLGGRMTFRVTGTPNLPATIEAMTNVAAALWIPLVTNSTASGAFNYTNTAVGIMPARFYRAVYKL